MPTLYQKFVSIIFFLTISAVLLIFYRNYNQSILLASDEIRKQHHVAALQMSRTIRRDILILIRELKTLSSQQNVGSRDQLRSRQQISEAYDRVSRLSVNDTGILDRNGIVVISHKAPFLQGKDFSFRNYFKNLKNSPPGSIAYEFIDFKGVDIGEKGIVLSSPIVNDNKNFDGVVLFTVKIAELLENSILRRTSEEEIWIVDDSGTVLFHPTLREGNKLKTVLKNTSTSKTFFEDIEKGIPLKVEIENYKGDQEKWIATSLPLNIADQIWSIFVVTSEKAVGHRLTSLHIRNLVTFTIGFIVIVGSVFWTMFLMKKAFVNLKEEMEKRRQAEEKLKYLAMHDSLTGLPSRLLCADHIVSALASARRTKTKAAILFVDLDGFKNVNDTMGHDAGDRLLVSVSERLVSSVREVDTVARIGGDEFIVVLVNIDNRKNVAIVAEKLNEAMTCPFPIGGKGVSISASIGIAMYPDDAQEAELLMQRADAAMYSVKVRGKNDFSFAREADDRITGTVNLMANRPE